MTRRARSVLAVTGGLLLLGVLGYVVYRPYSTLQGTFAAQAGGFTVTKHRLHKFDWLLPSDAWHLRHSREAFQRLWEVSNFGRMPFPRDVALEEIKRREIERTFGLPARSLDGFDVYFGDAGRMSQIIVVARDRTESYYIAASYI